MNTPSANASTSAGSTSATTHKNGSHAADLVVEPTVTVLVTCSDADMQVACADVQELTAAAPTSPTRPNSKHR